MTPPLIFLFGAPRSGTTYLQNLLGAHPEIATPQETTLFTFYLGPWVRRWEQQLPSEDELRRNAYRFAGLPAVLTESEFRNLVGSVADRVYRSVLALKPSASIVLDKVPEYALEGQVIHEYLPDATFVHIIRDGRDVACSMVRAAHGWGHRWAPRTVAAAANRWKNHVESGRRMARLTDRYVEVRYEDLLGPGGPAVLERVLAGCGLELPAAEVARIHEEQRLKDGRAASHLVWGGVVRQRIDRDPEEPKGFFGQGRAGGWEDEMSAYDRWVFDQAAGALLVELGYAENHDWARSDFLDRVAPVRYWAERGAAGAYRRATRAVRGDG